MTTGNSVIGEKTSAKSAAETYEKGRVFRMKAVYTGLFAALSYVVFTFLQIKVPLPGGDATSIHLGNAVVVLGALILGGVWGGLGGAIGMTIGDLFDPIYVVYAPKTFFCKLFIGIITGLVAHRLFRLNATHEEKKVLRISAAAAAAGLIFNMIADPLIGYFYKRAILGRPAAQVTLAWNIASTSINAVISLIASVLLYRALRGPLRRAGVIGTKEGEE